MASEDDLKEMLSIANDTGMPVGRVFVMTGAITESDLTNLIACQSFVKERLIDLPLAQRAMRLTKEKSISFGDALTGLGWTPKEADRSTPLGELLLGAEYISQHQLDAALIEQKKSGLPIGRKLVLSGVLSESLIAAAVNAQIMVRDCKISKEQAIDVLKEARKRQVSFETSVLSKGFYDLPKRKTPRIGELLTSAGLLSDSELVSALETGLITKQLVGQVLVRAKLVTREVLAAALECQKLLAAEKIRFSDVRIILGYVKDGKKFDWALQKVAAETPVAPKPTPLSLYTFLKMLKCVDDTEVTQAFESAKHNANVISQILLIGGVTDEVTLQRAEQCRNLVEEGRLTLEHATIAFDYSTRKNTTVADAIRELQWQASESIPAKPKPAPKIPQQSEIIDLGELQQQAIGLFGKGDHAAALQVWDKILQHLKAPYDHRYSETLENMGNIYCAMEDFQNAKKCYQTAYESRKTLHGDDSLSAAFAVNNLGRIAYHQNRYQDAENYGKEYIRIIAANMGSEHPDVACGYQNLATVYHKQEKLEAAELAYATALRICSAKLGDLHPTTARIARDRASLLQRMNRLVDAQNIDPLASGKITGSWRAIEVPKASQLNDE